MKMIPHNKPTLGKKEADATARVVRSGWVTQGNEVDQFENEFCHFVGLPRGHAVAVSSGSAALYISLITLKVSQGDEIIVPTYVCSALLNAVYLAGATPILADIDPTDFNLSVGDTQKKITKKTKAIILPHTYGMPADINSYKRLGIPIIEDCALALGSHYKGKHVGTFGDIGVFSFYASKTMTTGYGGMIITKKKILAEKVRDYREFDERKKYYPRFNFQMSDINAAVGRVQLKQLPLFLTARKKAAKLYYQSLPSKSTWPPKMLERKANFHRFLIRTKNPRRIQKQLAQKGVQTIIPTETYELLHRYLKQSSKHFMASEEVAKTTLSIPIFPSLSQTQIKIIARALSKISQQDLL